MFAVLKFGDIQYKAIPGEAIAVDNLSIEEGGELSITDIAMISNADGVLFDSGDLMKYKVVAQVIKNYRDDKVIVFKKKRRKGYTRKRGHRQDKTLLLIKEIVKI